ncbi:hypothetical protein EMCG_04602 [[Emmonsia] crescens]|uniref:ATPase AAA-type core domain-containing protein n=1 Tax=[Emmonsia] crescens TaxID=73230 RepID=A0A0G2J7A4_9EURO|nr:hypothetical protein EMCG_04602 [Emmonsia crescens UAMH 3008]
MLLICRFEDVGKTSLVQAAAGTFDLDIYMLSLTGQSIADDELQWLCSHLPRHCLLLIEDIDSAGINREKTTAVTMGKIRFYQPPISTPQRPSPTADASSSLSCPSQQPRLLLPFVTSPISSQPASQRSQSPESPENDFDRRYQRACHRPLWIGPEWFFQRLS